MSQMAESPAGTPPADTSPPPTLLQHHADPSSNAPDTPSPASPTEGTGGASFAHACPQGLLGSPLLGSPPAPGFQRGASEPAAAAAATSAAASASAESLGSPATPGSPLVGGSVCGSSASGTPKLCSVATSSSLKTRKDIKNVITARYSGCTHKMRTSSSAGRSCYVCKKSIWSMSQTMKCAHCGIFTHGKCLPHLLYNSPNSSLGSGLTSDPSSPGLPTAVVPRDLPELEGSMSPLRLHDSPPPAAAPAPASPRALQSSEPANQSQSSFRKTAAPVAARCATHIVQNITLLAPTNCTHCKTFIWGVLNQGYSCNACGEVYHKKCVQELGIEVYNTKHLKREAKQGEKAEEGEGKHEAITVLKGLLSDFSSRWSWRKKVSLANPVSMVKVSLRHSKQYAHLAKRFSLLENPARASDCSHAMLYAKAVYGVAYADGHLRSIGSAMRMHTVLKPFKDVGNDPTSKQNDVGVLQSLQEGEEEAVSSARELVMSEWSNKVYAPAFALFADHDKNWVVLSVRGTVSDKDTLTDLAAEPTPFCPTVDDGAAHSGMVKCTEFVLRHPVLQQALADYCAKFPAYRVVVTGHSLGGAVATMFSISMRERAAEMPASDPDALWMARVECFAFGPPPTVNGPVLEKVNPRNYITSVVCGMDAVPRVSLTNLERLAREVAGFKHHELHVDNPHVRMHIPGRLILIDRPIGRSKSKECRIFDVPHSSAADHVHRTVENTAPPDPSPCVKVAASECGHWILAMLYVSRHMFGDHLPDRYHDSLKHWAKLKDDDLQAVATADQERAEREMQVAQDVAAKFAAAGKKRKKGGAAGVKKTENEVAKEAAAKWKHKALKKKDAPAEKEAVNGSSTDNGKVVVEAAQEKLEVIKA